MNLHYFHMEVTASERRCKCFGCKQEIAPKARHLRLQSVDGSYCFKLCETCLQEAVLGIQEGLNVKLIKSRRLKCGCGEHDSCDQHLEQEADQHPCYEGE